MRLFFVWSYHRTRNRSKKWERTKIRSSFKKFLKNTKRSFSKLIFFFNRKIRFRFRWQLELWKFGTSCFRKLFWKTFCRRRRRTGFRSRIGDVSPEPGPEDPGPRRLESGTKKNRLILVFDPKRAGQMVARSNPGEIFHQEISVIDYF